MTADDPLEAWLAWQEQLHPRPIELGLERVAAVWARLESPPCAAPIITVGGTNGKGSCVAYLEAIYGAAGYRTASYTSPHLLRYTERIRLAGTEVSETALCAAFARVDQARAATSLTYFEFGTLAAVDLFVRADPDVILLEVGLGGRLDAVNLWSADVAIITNIGHDHQAWLGNDLETIGREKAGIMRPGRPVILGQRQPPLSLRTHADQLGAPVLQLGQEFDYQVMGNEWMLTAPHGTQQLALPTLRGGFQLDNAAAVWCAIGCLQSRLPVTTAALNQGLTSASLPGRFQHLPGAPSWIIDVAHNQESALALAENLRTLKISGQRHAVCAILNDKDPAAIVKPLLALIDHWHLGTLDSPRAYPAAALANDLQALGVAPERIQVQAEVTAALDHASALAQPADQIVVTGSFLTVAAALRTRSAEFGI